MRRRLLLPFLMLLAPAAGAATLHGVTLPDSVTLQGADLRLNGIALRTYSFLAIPIYVVALYVPSPTHDGEALMDSTAPMLLRIQFVHDVGQGDARHAWREGFERNCNAPCAVPADEIERFVSAVPGVQSGQAVEMRFGGGKVTLLKAGQDLGTVDDPRFTRLILSTFIGRGPATPRLKRELLGMRS